jgi:(R,R)-butanediol dehydrogenase/meso-butanediol dehydrogenase/diacetyl reductase
MTKMKAAVYYGPGDVRIEDQERPVPGNGEVLLKVTRSGMCGTDASEWKSGPIIFPLNKPHPVSGHMGPLILGHEFIGEIVELGTGVTGWAHGDRAASGAGISCGLCARCLEGRTNLCQQYVTHGLNRHGGMAEFVAVPISTLVALPKGLSDDRAGLAQPLAVGLHAARRAGVKSGDTVVLIGAGAIGTFVLAGLKHLYQASVVVVDFAGERLDRAARLGADQIVTVDEHTDANVREAVGALGADVVIEASGAPGQINRGASWLRQGGTLLQVGLPSKPQEINIHYIVMSEITMQTTLAHVCGQDIQPALEILSSTSLADELLEGVFPLTDLATQLDRLATGQIQGKVLFDPQPTS